jgi:phosphoribosylanthranilate isomerase
MSGERPSEGDAAQAPQEIEDQEVTPVLVKICGVTLLDDARAAVDAGASAIGFVFWPGSPRFIDPFRARGIAAALPAFVSRVGVFVDQPIEYVSGVAALVRLSAVQLHGSETPAYVAAVRRPVVKALTAPNGDSFATGGWPSNVTLLLDAHDPVKRGGTGQTIDWTAAAQIAARRPILLAGGIAPENVTDAITRVRPFGIDVSSGVEDAPGIKNHGRLAALFKAIHAIDTDNNEIGGKARS